MKGLKPAFSANQEPRLLDQLRNRLFLIIGLLLLCFVFSVGISVYAVYSQQQLGAQKVRIHDDIDALLQSMVDQETGLRGYVSTNSTTFLDPYTNGHTQYSAILQRLNNETAGANFRATATALTVVDEKAATWSTTFAEEQITEMQQGRFDAARSEQTNIRGKILFDDVRRAVARLQLAADEDLANVQTVGNVFDLCILAGAGLLTLIAIFWLWRTFSAFATAQRNQFELIKHTAEAFGEGDLSVRVQNVTDADLRAVGHTFNEMAATLEEQQNALRDRDILEQVSQLNGILTASLDLNELIESFLRAALPLLDLQVGALYIADQHENRLSVFASRGVQVENLHKSFAPGEGLIGRVAQERRPLMITRPPQSEAQAFRVRTMLGEVLPSSLYHLPLLRGNELLGVLVVGSIHSMREQTRNALFVVASNVASAISNAQAYARIQEQARALTELAREQELTNQALRQQRDELTVLNAALEEANRSRSRFLSTMSHELRTPLTSIIGFGQMLLRPSARASLSERQAGNIERMLKNAQHLLILINDVLDLAKVEAGRMDVNVTEVDLRELLDSVAEETRSVTVARGLRLIVDVADDVQTIETDPLKLRQIVLNLLSNALKFTEKGRIAMTATRRMAVLSESEDGIEAEHVAIAVQDTGIGIAPEQQARIFEAFYQVDSSNSRSYSGTGLGLSIVREFTTLLGGRVEIESEPQQGTTFTVLLPLRMPDHQALQEARLNALQDAQMPASWQEEDLQEAQPVPTDAES